MKQCLISLLQGRCSTLTHAEGSSNVHSDYWEKVPKLFTCSSSPRIRGSTATTTNANDPPSVLELIRTKMLHLQAVHPKLANHRNKSSAQFCYLALLKVMEQWEPSCARVLLQPPPQSATLTSKSSLHQQTLKCLSSNKSSPIINQG